MSRHATTHVATGARAVKRMQFTHICPHRLVPHLPRSHRALSHSARAREGPSSLLSLAAALTRLPRHQCTRLVLAGGVGGGGGALSASDAAAPALQQAAEINQAARDAAAPALKSASEVSEIVSKAADAAAPSAKASVKRKAEDVPAPAPALAAAPKAAKLNTTFDPLMAFGGGEDEESSEDEEVAK